MRKVTPALVGVLALLGVIGLSIAAWQLGWFVEAKNVDRQVQIDNRNKGAQVAWRDQARQTISDYRLLPPEDTANRGALRNQACDLISRLVPSYKDTQLTAFEARECA